MPDNPEIPSPSPPSAPPRRSRARRLIRRGLLLCLALFLGLNFLAAVRAYRLSRFEEAPKAPLTLLQRLDRAILGTYSIRSRNHDLPQFAHKDFRLKTKDGYALSVWESLSPPQTSSTVLLLHGHGANRSALLPEAEVFLAAGSRVVLIDFRAHGASSGSVSSVGYYEARDVKAAWDYIQSSYPDTTTTLYGVSMGAVAAARAVHQYHLTPRALIIEMPYDRLLDAIRARVKLMGVPAEPAATLLAFYGGVEQSFWPFSHRTSDYLRGRSIPTLLQWGDADKRVSRSEIDTISQSLTSAVQVQIYHGLGHESLHKKQPVKWRQAVLRFLDSLPPFH